MWSKIGFVLLGKFSWIPLWIGNSPLVDKIPIYKKKIGHPIVSRSHEKAMESIDIVISNEFREEKK